MKSKVVVCALLTMAGMIAGSVQAAEYDVQVTNLTKLQTFTPLLLVSHSTDVRLFEAGSEATSELEAIAEAGDIGPLDALLGTIPHLVGDTNTNGGLLGPGETTTIRISAAGRFRVVSLIGMLIPTNDTFVAGDSIALPVGGETARVTAIAYDAGTEANDQDCANIPGPRCGGEGLSDPAEGDEGFIHVSNGFHDLAGQDGGGSEILGPFDYDWKNPVARITIQRVFEDNRAD